MPLLGVHPKNWKQALKYFLYVNTHSDAIRLYSQKGKQPTGPLRGEWINTHWNIILPWRGMKYWQTLQGETLKICSAKEGKHRRPLLCDSIHRRPWHRHTRGAGWLPGGEGCPQGPGFTGWQAGWCWLHNTANVQNVLNHTPLNGLFHIMWILSQ